MFLLCIVNKKDPLRAFFYIPISVGFCGCSFCGSLVIMHSVVSNVLETLAAFCNALRVTFVGSIIPFESMST